MHDTALALAAAIPSARHRELAGETHAARPEALASVLLATASERLATSKKPG
jgi:hypothetical protein